MPYPLDGETVRTISIIGTTVVAVGATAIDVAAAGTAGEPASDDVARDGCPGFRHT